jgi:hypothetical protein
MSDVRVVWDFASHSPGYGTCLGVINWTKTPSTASYPQLRLLAIAIFLRAASKISEVLPITGRTDLHGLSGVQDPTFSIQLVLMWS